MGMVKVEVRVPEKMVELIDKLVEAGFYSSRSDLIRDAIRKFLMHYYGGEVE